MEPELVLALLLAALAGWVDAAGLASSGDVFLSFMSGNTTDLAVATFHHDVAKAATIVAVLLLFVFGVIIGERVEPLARRRGQSLVLALVSAALAASAALHPVAGGFTPLYPAVLAMGLQNATMHRAGGINIGLTYVTGTLVQIGRAIAGGDGKKADLHFTLWASLAIGAGLGAAALSVSAIFAMAAAAAIAASLALVTALR